LQQIIPFSMPETLHVKNVGPIATWPFAWTIVKAFVIGDMWVHDRAKKCPHSQIEK
jgi:hypothetical protein